MAPPLLSRKKDARGRPLKKEFGAWLAIPLGILWMGRRHWAEVIKSVFRMPKDDTDLRNKCGGTALLVGMGGVLCWLLWVGVPFVWALGLV